MNKLKKEFEDVVSKIIKAFEEKQEVSFEFFVSDDYTTTACFGDILYFNLEDICHDIFTQQPKGLIIQWQDDFIDNQSKFLNYKSYCMGGRFSKNTTPDK